MITLSSSSCRKMSAFLLCTMNRLIAQQILSLTANVAAVHETERVVARCYAAPCSQDNGENHRWRASSSMNGSVNNSQPAFYVASVHTPLR